jgi:hypothetical protein
MPNVWGDNQLHNWQLKEVFRKFKYTIHKLGRTDWIIFWTLA